MPVIKRKWEFEATILGSVPDTSVIEEFNPSPAVACDLSKTITLVSPLTTSNNYDRSNYYVTRELQSNGREIKLEISDNSYSEDVVCTVQIIEFESGVTVNRYTKIMSYSTSETIDVSGESYDSSKTFILNTAEFYTEDTETFDLGIVRARFINSMDDIELTTYSNDVEIYCRLEVVVFDDCTIYTIENTTSTTEDEFAVDASVSLTNSFVVFSYKLDSRPTDNGSHLSRIAYLVDDSGVKLRVKSDSDDADVTFTAFIVKLPSGSTVETEVNLMTGVTLTTGISIVDEDTEFIMTYGMEYGYIPASSDPYDTRSGYNAAVSYSEGELNVKLIRIGTGNDPYVPTQYVTMGAAAGVAVKSDNYYRQRTNNQ